MTPEFIEALITECSIYEKRLAMQLEVARQDAPDRVSDLGTMIDAIRRLKAELIAARPNSSIQRYSEALERQQFRRDKRAKLTAIVMEKDTA
jgi:hypothetical protein